MVKLVVYDFDGVLTDNKVWVSQDGAESVACSRSDGWWIKEITKSGIEQIILSTEKNPVVTARAQKIGLQCVQGAADKKASLLEIVKNKNISLHEVCYVGNEMNDAECMRIVGFPMAPEDSHPEILKIAKYKLNCKGGNGIARFIFDWLEQEKTNKVTAPSQSFSTTTKWQARIQTVVQDSIKAKEALLADKNCLALLEEMGMACADALAKGKKVIFAGNGGSFADSMHLSAEFVSKLQIDRGPLASIALGCSNSNLTAIGNDYGYEDTFSREMYALGQAGDVFIAISTSGNSPNILKAVAAAKEKGLRIYGWSGLTGGKLAQECSTLCVPSKATARIQECHIMIGHLLCEMAEANFLPKQI